MIVQSVESVVPMWSECSCRIVYRRCLVTAVGLALSSGLLFECDENLLNPLVTRPKAEARVVRTRDQLFPNGDYAIITFIPCIDLVDRVHH